MYGPLFKELKRRNVYKVAVAYLVLAWVVIQVTSLAVPALHLPLWTNSAVFFFGAIGFPFALFFAWEFELTPDGVKRESEILPEDSFTAHTGRKLDFFIIGLLVVALGYFIYESRFTSQPNETVVTENTVIKDSIQSATKEPKGTSIAVLPFVNMSSDKEQEYFSDGISEEILNVLAKIPKLHVTSRSSAFSFKGKEIIVSEVAKKLGVKHVLEGSVRKFGNRIRITAQLIEAESDAHLWSETYDRELVDLFAIQDEISSSIVKSLKTKLGLDPLIVKRDMTAVNLEAHNEYLKGLFYAEKRTPEKIEIALEHFNKAIKIAPNYAAAWMGKAWAIHFSSEFFYGSMTADLSYKRAKLAIDKAFELEPTMPEVHAIKGLITNFDRNNSEEAALHLEKAIELNPNYADAYTWYAEVLWRFPNKRLELRQKAVQLNPMSLTSNENLGYSLAGLGRFEEAHTIVKHIQSINPEFDGIYQLLSTIDYFQGNIGKSLYNSMIASTLNDAVNKKVNVAFTLYQLGLTDLVEQLVDETIYEHLTYLLSGNTEQWVKEIRATYPREKNDVLGHFLLGEAEIILANYQAAIPYLEESICDNCSFIIYAYQQVNDLSKAQELIDERQKDYQFRFADGQLGLDKEAAYFTYLMGDIDKAIAHLKASLDKGYLLGYRLLMMPMYQELRDHPEWPEILSINNQRKKIQADIYLKLVAEDKT